jgi:GntR family carbon starvation induced transcriptional regulator
MSGNSRTAETYEILKFHILDGVYLPREKLKIDQLAEDLSINPGAVREALSRLTSDGLVHAEPQKGFVVAPISITDLTDLTAVRIDIETRCLAQAIAAGDLKWEARLISAHHQLSRTAGRSGDGAVNRDWLDAHTEFHDALVSACGSRWWLRLRSQLYLQAERYRRLSLPFVKKERDIDAEHKAIVEATLQRKTTIAVSLLAEHLRKTSEILIRSEVPFDDAVEQRASKPKRLYGRAR